MEIGYKIYRILEQQHALPVAANEKAYLLLPPTDESFRTEKYAQDWIRKNATRNHEYTILTVYISND
jgi:hypothetical protein